MKEYEEKLKVIERKFNKLGLKNFVDETGSIRVDKSFIEDFEFLLNLLTTIKLYDISDLERESQYYINDGNCEENLLRIFRKIKNDNLILNEFDILKEIKRIYQLEEIELKNRKNNINNNYIIAKLDFKVIDNIEDTIKTYDQIIKEFEDLIKRRKIRNEGK